MAGLGDVEALERLSEAVVTTGERIADVVAAHPEFAGMGTTLTALAWLGGEPARVAVLHVGDSRAYLVRDGEMAQITRDHTYVQTLIDSGRISAEEALTHPRRNLLMRAIDGVHPAEPDVSVREAREGDRFLVCSDGLSGFVSDAHMHELLGLADPTAAVTALVDAALEAGAPDNVTCVVADVVREEEHEPAAPVVVGAAGEPRNREQLPDYAFPVDAQPSQSVLTVSSATGSASASIADVYREEQPARGRTSRLTWLVLATVIALVALLAAGLYAAWSATQRQFYVGSNGGYVTIFRGLPGELGPLSLHSVEQQTTLTVDSLPDFEAMQVQGNIPTDSLANAEQVVQRLGERAAQCQSVPTTPGCPDTSTTTPSPGSSP
jgi:protein phosphatase